MGNSTFINRHVTHQYDQSPVITLAGYDGCELPQVDEVTGSSLRRLHEFADSYESWKMRMNIMASIKLLTKRNRLKGSE